MDTRDIILLLLGIIIGAVIGYTGENYIKPYAEPYMLATTLNLTTNSTVVSVGQQVTFEAQLTVTIPSELESLQQYFKSQLLSNKLITLLMHTTTETHWMIIDSKQTIYDSTLDAGRVTFIYTININETCTFKASFSGTNILQSSESKELYISVG